MKKTIITATIGLLTLQLSWAQPPDMSPQCKEEMKKLAYFIGDWKGEAVHKGPKGAVTVKQTEHITWAIQDLVLSIQGTGRERNEKTKTDEITFQAFAVVNFHPYEKQFKWKSFVKEGFSTDAYFKVVGDNVFEWGFDIPNGGRTRYTITLDPARKTWHETGEYSRDGNQWYGFIELNLVKE
jgi:hypothetical protein